MTSQKNDMMNRWDTLDIMKAIGLCGALFIHVLIWYFGIPHEGIGMITYDMSAISDRILLTPFIMVHFLFISAGSAFYLYLKKYRPSLQVLLRRLLVFILLGLLFGLNWNPLILYWNVFFFYVLSMITLFFFERFTQYKTLLVFTISVLLCTPLLRNFVFESSIRSDFVNILLGNIDKHTIFYPFFPWFFLIGSGFLLTHYYQMQKEKSLVTMLIAGCILTPGIFFILTPLDFSDIFGTTSSMPIGYPLIVFSSFLVIWSLCEILLQKIPHSFLSVFIEMGRFILPSYIGSLLGFLFLLSFLKKTSLYREGSLYYFLFLEVCMFFILYSILKYWRYRFKK